MRRSQMSKPVAAGWSETAGELEERYRSERDVDRRKRLGALWLVCRGGRGACAGRAGGVGGRTVERWLGWYRRGGLAEVLRRVPGHGAVGQPHRLTAEQRAGGLAQGSAGGVRTFEEARGWVESGDGRG